MAPEDDSRELMSLLKSQWREVISNLRETDPLWKAMVAVGKNLPEVTGTEIECSEESTS